MAGFDDLYRMQQGRNNPLINVQQMQGRLPNWLSAPAPQNNNVAATSLFANTMQRIGDNRRADTSIEQNQQRLDIERQRARDLADIQMQTMQAKLKGKTDLSKSPTYLVDPKTGKQSLAQLSPTGQLHVVELPEGMEPSLPVNFLNTGSQYQAIPRGMNEPVGAIQRDLPPEALPETRGQQAAAVVKAKSQAEAQTLLPGAEIDLARVEKNIDQLLTHPGLSSGTGFSSIVPVVPGTERAGFESRREQLQGGAFLQAFQQLKGGGTVTEVEGLKAEQSLARMNTATSEKEYRAALEDFRAAVKDGFKKLQAKAGVAEEGGWTSEMQAELDELRRTQGALK